MCLFCKIARGDANNQLPENIIIHRSEDFYTKPALGSFVEGYSLINSNEHYESMKAIGASKLNKLETYISYEVAFLKGLYNSDVLIFEHGSIVNNCNKNDGCIGKCIPHAHCHILPTSVNPIPKLEEIFEHVNVECLNELADTPYRSYVLVSINMKSICVFKADDRVRSQFMRKMICNDIGMNDMWNWTEYPFRTNIKNYLTKVQLVNKTDTCLRPMTDNTLFLSH